MRKAGREGWKKKKRGTGEDREARNKEGGAEARKRGGNSPAPERKDCCRIEDKNQEEKEAMSNSRGLRQSPLAQADLRHQQAGLDTWSGNGLRQIQGCWGRGGRSAKIEMLQQK